MLHLSRASNICSVENCLESIIYSFEVNLMVLSPVLIRKYNIPNSYVKRELFEVIYSFQIAYFSCRYFQTFMFNVWLIIYSFEVNLMVLSPVLIIGDTCQILITSN